MTKEPVHRDDVRSGESQLCIEICGAGTLILLIHGWPLDRRIFAPQVAALSKHFRVLCFDRRGFGESEGKPDLRRELDDIDRILERYDDGSAVHLLGMSQGGRLALRYAVTRPGRLRSLCLQGAIIDGFATVESEEERIPLEDYVALVSRDSIGEFRKRWLRHPLMRLPETHKDAAGLLAQILADYEGSDLREYEPEMYAFSENVFGALATLTIPTLLLTGVHETPARKAHAEMLRQRLPDVREVVFQNSGHLCNLTEPEAYNTAVIDFCAGIDGKLKQRRP